MPEIKEILPFLIPLAIVEFALLIYTLRHILTHRTYRHGSRALWIIVPVGTDSKGLPVGMQFIGPILYFLLGREES